MPHAAACLMLLTAVLATFAEGDIIRLNDPNLPQVADGFNIAKDTSTGMEWLHLSLSTNISFDEILDEFGPGGRFEGFRHATAEELATFYANAGVTTIALRREEFVEAVERLLLALGSTMPEGSLTPDLLGKTQGIYDDGDLPNPGRSVLLLYAGDTANGDDPPAEGKIHIRPNFVEEDFEPNDGPGALALNRLGHFLVRPHTIPEPASVALVALFAGSLWGWWWWRGRP